MTLSPGSAPDEVFLEADFGRLYVEAATLLDAYRVSEAAELLGQLRTVTACEADGLQWKARIDFLWAIYAIEQPMRPVCWTTVDPPPSS